MKESLTKGKQNRIPKDPIPRMGKNHSIVHRMDRRGKTIVG